MEFKSTGRFKLGKQSSLKPDNTADGEDSDGIDISEDIGINYRLVFLASEGDAEGVGELLDSRGDVNSMDADGRTTLHVAACQGHPAVVELLLRKGAKVDPKDRWGSTGLQVQEYSGNFCRHIPTDIDIPAVNPFTRSHRLFSLRDYVHLLLVGAVLLCFVYPPGTR